MGERTGVGIDPLLQATDPNVFRPGSGPRVGTVFVGSTRGEDRPIVQAAFNAGLKPRIVGSGWSGRVPGRAVIATSMDRAGVAALYRAAEIVLNDHWGDMAAAGFLSNRIFDAVASGAWVLSDAVPGIGDVFGAAVTVVSDTREIKAIMRDPDRRPSSEQLLAAAARVRRDETFDRRAETLFRAVATRRRQTPV
jgi:spore maturation protein CgeB